MTIRIVGATPDAAGVIRFADSESWDGPPALQVPDGRRPLDVAAIFFGDEECGPVLFLFATAPGVSLPASEPHGHASDSWRMPLKGSFKMGRTEYGAGDARFQRGWRTYPSDNFASGPDGGWLALFFADRRGTRAQRPGAADTGPNPAERAVAEWIGLSCDDVEREQDVPESQLSTPAGDGARTGHVNLSFGPTFPSTGGPSDVNRFVGQVGATPDGPVVVMTQARAGTELGRRRLGSEAVSIVVSGGCTGDGQSDVAGDVRVHRSGEVAESSAGPHGLAEVLLVAKRLP